MIRFYIIGLAILITAILANVIALKLGYKTWYDFIGLLSSHGFFAVKSIRFIDGLWLFVLYPLTLGGGYLVGENFYKLLFR